MNTLSAEGFAIDPDYNPMTWPYHPEGPDRLASNCHLGHLLGGVNAFIAKGRVFASRSSHGRTQFWLISEATPSAAIVRVVIPR